MTQVFDFLLQDRGAGEKYAIFRRKFIDKKQKLLDIFRGTHGPVASLALWRAGRAHADLSAALRARWICSGPRLPATLPRSATWCRRQVVGDVALAGTARHRPSLVRPTSAGAPAGLPARQSASSARLRSGSISAGLLGLCRMRSRNRSSPRLCDEPRLTALLLLAGLRERNCRLATAAGIEALASARIALRHTCESAMRRRCTRAEADRRSLVNRLRAQDIAEAIVGATRACADVMERDGAVARSDAPVLRSSKRQRQGGRGPRIHRQSPRAEALSSRNCGAIPPAIWRL